MLTNLDVSVENLAIRVVTGEAKSIGKSSIADISELTNTCIIGEKIPTLLIRTNAISFKKLESNTAVKRDPTISVDDV